MMETLRLFAALGPGDIVRARRNRAAGLAVSETSIAFSEQLFAYCRHTQIKILAISSHEKPDRLEEENLTLENRPKPFRGRGGLMFHLSQIVYAADLAFRAWYFGAELAIIDSGTTHYFALTLFRLLGIPVAVNLHNVLWPRGYPPKGMVGKSIRNLNQVFFRYAAVGAIGVSPECEAQVLLESRGAVPFFQYRCQFDSVGFQPADRYRGGTFRIAFVGRAEQSKGLLDVAEIASALRNRSSVKVVFEVCGDGPALPRLMEVVKRRQLDETVLIRGRLERGALLQVYARSHAVIVPTRSNFTEGMPQVCAEAVLSDLPVITSQVANAFDVIGASTLRSETDDVQSYVTSIMSLIEDRSLYQRLRTECGSLSLQFLDRSRSYPAAVDRLIGAIFGRALLADYAGLFGEADNRPVDGQGRPARDIAR